MCCADLEYAVENPEDVVQDEKPQVRCVWKTNPPGFYEEAVPEND